MIMQEFPFFGRRKRVVRRGQNVRAARSRRPALGAEMLEPRALLAADFHNELAPLDVNKDGWLSNSDVLLVVADLRNNGPRFLDTVGGPGGIGMPGMGGGGVGGGGAPAPGGLDPSGPEGEPSGLGGGPYIDVNGDNYASPMDAFIVIGGIRRRQAEGENETVAFHLQTTRTPGGAPTSFFGLGETFHLEVYVEDLRPPAPDRGVASAFMDLLWDSGIVSVIPAIPTTPEFFDFEITFGPEFDDPVFTEVGSQAPQLIDEVGSISDDISEPLGSGRFLLFSIPFTADALGTVTFSSDFATEPTNEVTTNEPPAQVLANDILFGTWTVDIVDVRAVDDVVSLPEDSVDVPIDPVDNDVSTSGTPTLTGVVTQPANGVLVLNDNGTPSDATDDFLLYTPNPDYFGPDSFTYRMSDGSATDTATVTITVTEVNDAPVVVGESLSTRLNESVNFSLTDLLAGDTAGPANESSQSLSIVLPLPATTAQGGTIVDNGNGTYTYTPPVDFVGDDTFEYTVVDDGTTNGQPAPATTNGTVTITVRPLVESVAFWLRTVDPATGNPVETVAPGDTFRLQVYVDDLRDPPEDGGVGAAYVDVAFDTTFPAPGIEMISTNQVITFGTALPNEQRGSVTSDTNPGVIDEAGAANFDLNTTVGNAPVLLFSVDFLVTASFNGLVEFRSNPADNVINEVVLADTGLVVPEEEILFGSTVLEIQVPSPNPPVAVADSYVTDEDVDLVVSNPGNLSGDGDPPTGAPPYGVLANDTDVDQAPAWPSGTTLETVLVSTTSNGVLTLNSNGTFTYEPNEHFFGTDSFQYRASDGVNESGVVTVTITVNSVNDPPLANDDPENTTAYNVDLGATLNVPAAEGLLINDFDADGLGLTPPIEPGSTVDVTTPPLFGVVQVNDDGSFSYTPDNDVRAGTIDTFEYTLTDPAGASASAMVTIAIGATPGDIVGAVYFDADNDGVKDSNERGLGGVQIRLTGSDLFGNPPLDLLLTTNSDGSYMFPDILPGDYTLEQFQPAFLLDGFESVNDIYVPGSATSGNPANDRFANIGPNSSTVIRSYNFGERGLRPEYFTLWEFVFSSSETGVSAALDATGKQLWYVVGRTGWEGIVQVEISLNSDQSVATVVAVDSNGDAYETSLPTSDPRIEYLPVSGGFFVRLEGDFADFDFEPVP